VHVKCISSAFKNIGAILILSPQVHVKCHQVHLKNKCYTLPKPPRAYQVQSSAIKNMGYTNPMPSSAFKSMTSAYKKHVAITVLSHQVHIKCTQMHDYEWKSTAIKCNEKHEYHYAFNAVNCT